MHNMHDVGGMLGFGPVARHEDNPFAVEWKRLSFGLTLASIANGFLHSVDENRYAKERMRPSNHFNSSYFELWLAALELNLVENGVLALDAIEAVAAGANEQTMGEAELVLEPQHLAPIIDSMIDTGLSVAAELEQPREFALGDAVRIADSNTRRHSRVPRYVAGRTATVTALRSAYPVPQLIAHGLGKDPQWCYQIRLESKTLWGSGAEASPNAVYIDVWEPDLRPNSPS